MFDRITGTTYEELRPRVQLQVEPIPINANEDTDVLAEPTEAAPPRKKRSPPPNLRGAKPKPPKAPKPWRVAQARAARADE